ncbi:hypothetical protein LS71_008205 [Helicobacter jaachi]|uniref:Uncharacterized protein n=1 Tax=Helicobacter jaachi TaxID=1677920 RepID=A0A4U8T752_9HELI|nr:hypothetical protein [Helicobacter jaachi]TLD95480.1 hypothetical protein LS71_008205 [Helicobacter jaachi]
MSKNDKKEQKLYENYVNEVNNRIKTNQESQDKMILTISSALLALLPFVLEKLRLNYLTQTLVICLIVSNTISLIAVLLSFYFCTKGNKDDVKYAEEYYLQHKNDSLNKKSRWTNAGIFCNSVSLVMFAITLIIFATIVTIYFCNKE